MLKSRSLLSLITHLDINRARNHGSYTWFTMVSCLFFYLFTSLSLLFPRTTLNSQIVLSKMRLWGLALVAQCKESAIVGDTVLPIHEDPTWLRATKPCFTAIETVL